MKSGACITSLPTHRASLVPARCHLPNFPQAHQHLPVWCNNINPCSRRATAELVHIATLMPGQTGTQEQVGSRSPTGCRVVFWPQIVFLWVGERIVRPHRLRATFHFRSFYGKAPPQVSFFKNHLCLNTEVPHTCC